MFTVIFDNICLRRTQYLSVTSAHIENTSTLRCLTEDPNVTLAIDADELTIDFMLKELESTGTLNTLVYDVTRIRYYTNTHHN